MNLGEVFLVYFFIIFLRYLCVIYSIFAVFCSAMWWFVSFYDAFK